MSKTTEAKETDAAKGRGREWSPSFKRTVKFYDANFDRQEKGISGEIKPAKNLQEAYQLGMSEDEIVLALNNAAKMKEIEAKTKEALGTDAVSEAVLLKFIEPLRMIPRFAKIEKKADQTAAVINKIKSDPDLIDALRAAMAADAGGDSDNEDNQEQEESK